MRERSLCVALLVLAVLIIGAVCCWCARPASRAGRRALRGEGYLVDPYLDLDELGERGAPYALAECTWREAPVGSEEAHRGAAL
jgi:hypothetical protein